MYTIYLCMYMFHILKKWGKEGTHHIICNNMGTTKMKAKGIRKF